MHSLAALGSDGKKVTVRKGQLRLMEKRRIAVKYYSHAQLDKRTVTVLASRSWAEKKAIASANREFDVKIVIRFIMQTTEQQSE